MKNKQTNKQPTNKQKSIKDILSCKNALKNKVRSSKKVSFKNLEKSSAARENSTSNFNL